MDLAADRKTWENLTDVRLDDLEFATAWNEKSPVHVAIEKKHVECAEYILSKGKGAYQMMTSTDRPFTSASAYHHDGPIPKFGNVVPLSKSA